MYEQDDWPQGFIQVGSRYFCVERDGMKEEDLLKYWRVNYVKELSKELMERFFKSLKEEDIKKINNTLGEGKNFQEYLSDNIYYSGNIVKKLAGDVDLAKEKMQAFTVAINEIHRGMDLFEIRIRLAAYTQYLRFKHHTVVTGTKDRVTSEKNSVE